MIRWRKFNALDENPLAKVIVKNDDLTESFVHARLRLIVLLIHPSPPGAETVQVLLYFISSARKS